MFHVLSLLVMCTIVLFFQFFFYVHLSHLNKNYLFTYLLYYYYYYYHYYCCCYYNYYYPY